MNKLLFQTKQLIISRIPLSISLALVSILGFIITLTIFNTMGTDWLKRNFLFQVETFSFGNFYTIFTFPFAESFINATQNPIIFLLLGFIIEKKYNRKLLLLMVACSIYIGPLISLLFYFINLDMLKNVHVPAYFSGVRVGRSVYIGIFFAYYLKNMKTHKKKIWIHILFGLFFIGHLGGIIRLLYEVISFYQVRIYFIYYYFMLVVSFAWGMRSKTSQVTDKQKITTEST